MMGGNPSWWMRSSSGAGGGGEASNVDEMINGSNLNLMMMTQANPSMLMPMHHHHHHDYESSSPSLSSFMAGHGHENNFHAHSWSQLLLGGFPNSNNEEEEEERYDQQHVNNTSTHVADHHHHHIIKQEVTNNNNYNNNKVYKNEYNNNNNNNNEEEEEEQQQAQEENNNNNNNNKRGGNWSQMIMACPSPKSCVTSINSNILDFSTTKPPLDHSPSECNSTASGGAAKKARLQPSSTPPLKVRKEKLGDRITALHQLVSPFGKTDTASVLLEALGYIRFLHSQIEALSSPYMGNASARAPHSVHGERNYLFPEHPGQLLNDSCLKRRGAGHQDKKEGGIDLKSRGLCLVPISCTHLVGPDHTIGADYWASSLGGSF